VDIDNLIKNYLTSKGITGLYKHQIESLKSIREGKNIILTTATATGKTLAFNIPVLDTLLKNSTSTAIYLYPTKALARDQAEKIDGIVKEKFVYGVYDGDTSQSSRLFLRKYGKIIISNPDLLHEGILPNHTNWTKFFSHLKFVVVDEAHYYSGILGSHMSEIMRRLRRISHTYGSFPQFILASATIDNPEEFSFRLVGERFYSIGNFELPPSRKALIIFNPAVVDKKTNTRRSAYKEAVWVLRLLIENNIRTIAFSRSRQGAELITKYLKSIFPKDKRDLVSVYRAGYLKSERRLIERKLKNGELMGVVSTNALELGIDIGDLDATVIIGYPGTISSLFQQSGRSGRTKESITVFITSSNPLDQYFVKDPDYLFKKHFESATIDPDNYYVLRPHLKCAAYELPIRGDTDSDYFGIKSLSIVGELERKGTLEKRGKRFYYAMRDYPASKINIRGGGSQEIELIDIDTDKTIERISFKRALEETFKGAVYLHKAETYVVNELNLRDKFALLKSAKVNYYTDSLSLHKIEVLKTLGNRKIFGIDLYFGSVLVSERVIGFIRKQYGTDQKIGTEEVNLPETQFETKAIWFAINKDMEKTILDAGEEIPGTIHATEHLLVAMMPLVVICDRNDVGGVSHPLHPDTMKPTIFVYDGVEGGVGLSEKGFERFEDLVSAAYKTVSTCPCKDGCPSCIYSPKCGNDNKPLTKKGAILLLGELLNNESG
jgi:DEAD/DEAH box helicase domain-containing protein